MEICAKRNMWKSGDRNGRKVSQYVKATELWVLSICRVDWDSSYVVLDLPIFCLCSPSIYLHSTKVIFLNKLSGLLMCYSSVQTFSGGLKIQ